MPYGCHIRPFPDSQFVRSSTLTVSAVAMSSAELPGCVSTRLLKFPGCPVDYLGLSLHLGRGSHLRGQNTASHQWERVSHSCLQLPSFAAHSANIKLDFVADSMVDGVFMSERSLQRLDYLPSTLPNCREALALTNLGSSPQLHSLDTEREHLNFVSIQAVSGHMKRQ